MMGGVPQFDDQGRLITYQYDEYGQAHPVAVPAPRAKPFVRHDCLRSSAEVLQFGLRDLVLRGDFTDCTSELEFSYGLGLRPGSAEARSFLAGTPSFTPEVVEIWAVAPADSVPPTPLANMMNNNNGGGDGADNGEMYNDNGYDQQQQGQQQQQQGQDDGAYENY